jgi:hypothetical protein
MRHPLAVLRSFLKIGQKELAEILGCSVSTIQSVELGRLKMSDELAKRASVKTGVSCTWLLAGDPGAPMTTGNSRYPYTRDCFERHQARGASPNSHFPKCWLPGTLFEFYVALREILHHAHGKNELELTEYKIRMAIKGVRKEMRMGEDRRSPGSGISVDEEVLSIVREDLAEWEREGIRKIDEFYVKPKRRRSKRPCLLRAESPKKRRRLSASRR